MYTPKDLLESLNYPLPEDIFKVKSLGDFKKVQELINLYLNDPFTPTIMKKRLKLESSIIERLPYNYPYSFDEALKIIQEEIPDFKSIELQEAMDTKKADFIYIDKIPHFQRRFFASMKKVYKEIADRCSTKELKSTLLDDTINNIVLNGPVSYTYTIKSTLKIADEYFKPGKVLVHLPIPTLSSNISNIEILETSHKAYIAPETSASRTISFNPTLTTNEPFSVTYKFTCTASYQDLPVTDTYVDIQEYLGEEEPQITFTPAIKALANELSKGEDNLLVKAWRFYEYCSNNVTYSFMRDYITLGNIPEYALSQRIGDCGVKALLFITLCRCVGIPAHWQSGLYVNPEHVGNHDWAMFYIAPFGWLYADPSFGGSANREGNDNRYAYYFGHLDPFRMVANNAFQQEFDPPKKHLRKDPYDNQSGEVEYEDEGLWGNMYQTTHEIIEYQKN